MRQYLFEDPERLFSIIVGVAGLLVIFFLLRRRRRTASQKPEDPFAGKFGSDYDEEEVNGDPTLYENESFADTLQNETGNVQDSEIEGGTQNDDADLDDDDLQNDEADLQNDDGKLDDDGVFDEEEIKSNGTKFSDNTPVDENTFEE